MKIFVKNIFIKDIDVVLNQYLILEIETDRLNG